MTFRACAVSAVKRIMVACVAALLLPLLSFAQTSKGIIAGAVHDATGAVIVGARRPKNANIMPAVVQVLRATRSRVCC